jgi:hypothetical protein
MRTTASALFVGSLVFLLTTSVHAQDGDAVKPIGKVVTVTGTATIEHTGPAVVQAALGSAPANAKVGELVYQGDVVQTGTDGKLNLLFNDGTAFNVSSSARMTLDEFVYDPNSKSNSTLFHLTKGAFTFVAGKVAKTGDMKIDTPVATMGIRGTTPRVEITEDGRVAMSTLVEEGRGSIDKQATDPSKRRTLQQRQARAGQGVSVPVDASFDKNIDIKLKICKGC